MIARLANRLLADGVTAGARVAFVPANDHHTLATFWACWQIGAVTCPFSPHFPLTLRDCLLQQLDARWYANLAKLTDARDSEFGNKVANYEPIADSLIGRSLFPDEVTSHRPATVVFSSGSTGDPKAIVHTLAAHRASAIGAAANIPLQAGDRWLWSLPAYHVSGLSIIVRCADAGATVVGVQSGTRLSSQLLEQEGITHLSLVPTQLRRLLDEGGLFPTPKLRSVLLGGSATPRDLWLQAIDRGVPIHLTYGMTEMASQITTTRCQPTSDIHSGHVLPNRELQIAADGEILVRGDTLCLGYWRDGKIVPVVDSDGWFHTGDRGHLDSEEGLCVWGRKDNMFISGGENLHPESIERALMQLPGIRQAIVVARYDHEFGARPVAFVEANEWNESSWRAELQLVLPRYAIPVAFRKYPEPAAERWKPDRRQFEAWAASGTPPLPND